MLTAVRSLECGFLVKIREGNLISFFFCGEFLMMRACSFWELNYPK